MSVINQVLLDLEKRRASSAERGAVPNHVRALPDEVHPLPWGWIAGGVGALLAAGAAWMLLAGASVNRTSPPAQHSGAEAAIESVVTASAGMTPSARPADGNAGPAPASRLSFDLSSVPEESLRAPRSEEPAAEPRLPAPVPTARVIGRAEPDPEPREMPAAAKPRVRPERADSKPASVADAASQPEIKKQVRQPTAREQAENEYRKAVALLNQGKLPEAQEGFETALSLFPPYHPARQALVGVYIERKKPADAERVLQDGLALAPAQIGFAMALARLQIDHGDTAQAAATLRKGLDYAQGSPDYIAFYAAVLQRQGQHEEAIGQFQSALRARPTAGVWWLGLGISLQAANRAAEAQEAFRRARASNNLSPELAAFAEQRLKQLQ
jgi:MSHA biogenesis protein MshN